jgi:hypothetical protein
MADCFVDVSYRGLEVGRRLRMRDFAADRAYVELPTPMPVGTALEIATDEGPRIAAVVARVHEQVGGSDQPPGMRVTPALAGAGDAAAWWQARAAELPAPPEEPEPEPAPEPEAAVEPAVEATAAPEVPEAAAHPVVDDGKRTTVMSAVEIDEIVATGEPGTPPADDATVDGNGKKKRTTRRKRRRSKGG